MNELIKRIVEKTGLPEDKAKGAADAAIGFLKEKLPAPIAGQIDSAIGTNAVADGADKASGAVSGVTGKIGGMLGG